MIVIHASPSFRLTRPEDPIQVIVRKFPTYHSHLDQHPRPISTHHFNLNRIIIRRNFNIYNLCAVLFRIPIMALSVCLKISMFLVVTIFAVATAQDTVLSPSSSPSPAPGMDKGAAISVHLASTALTGLSLFFSLLPLLNYWRFHIYNIMEIIRVHKTPYVLFPSSSSRVLYLVSHIIAS